MVLANSLLSCRESIPFIIVSPPEWADVLYVKIRRKQSLILDHPKSTVWPRVIVTFLLFSVVLCVMGRCDVMVLEDWTNRNWRGQKGGSFWEWNYYLRQESWSWHHEGGTETPWDTRHFPFLHRERVLWMRGVGETCMCELLRVPCKQVPLSMRAPGRKSHLSLRSSEHSPDRGVPSCCSGWYVSSVVIYLLGLIWIRIFLLSSLLCTISWTEDSSRNENVSNTTEIQVWPCGRCWQRGWQPVQVSWTFPALTCRSWILRTPLVPDLPRWPVHLLKQQKDHQMDPALYCVPRTAIPGCSWWCPI